MVMWLASGFGKIWANNSHKWNISEKTSQLWAVDIWMVNYGSASKMQRPYEMVQSGTMS